MEEEEEGGEGVGVGDVGLADVDFSVLRWA